MEGQEMERLVIDIIRQPFPKGVYGASAFMNGRYIVLLNTSETKEAQEEAFIHEMRHIYRKDHFSGEDVQKIEASVRGMV